MSKIEKIRELMKEHRLLKNKWEVLVLSTLLGDVESKTKGLLYKEDVSRRDLVKGALVNYYNELLETNTKDSNMQLKFLRDCGVIENRMNSQEIDLQLLSIYATKSRDEKSFLKNPNRYNMVLTEFTKKFVPTVADFDIAKSRLNKIFKL